jgi:ATP-dependent helicase IRC3
VLENDICRRRICLNKSQSGILKEIEMSEKPTSDFYCKYGLTQARKYPSKKVPAGHQSEALDELHAWFEKKHSPAGGILVLPTGGGKTFVAVRFLCTGPLSQGYKVLWLAHTHHLLEQAFYSFGPKDEEEGKRSGYEVARIAETKWTLNVRVVSGTPGHFPVHQIKPDDDVVIGTLQTITRAYNDPQQRPLKAFLNSANGKLVVVFDEAHHSPAPSYRKLMTDLREAYPGMYLFGLTATPTYTDEKKRGWLKKLFPQGIIYQVSPDKLMADRILAKPFFEEPLTHFVPEFDEREYQKWVGTYRDLPEEIIDQLARSRERNTFIVESYVNDKERYGKTIMFADRWFQCEHLSEMLIQREVRAGVIYSHVDADPGSAEARNKRKKDENAKVLEAFRHNDLDVLINVRMLTEGTDVPDVQTVFLTRQTTSKILLTQMVGRALRGPKFGGTESAYIVAFIDNWKQAINWAGYDQLAEGIADESIPEYGKRPPLQLISIELVRQLVRQMDSGLNITPGPFLTLMPIGWYRIEFEALAEGSEDTETVRLLAMVFEDESESYQSFIQHLVRENIQEFADEKIDLSQSQNRLEGWQRQFFSQAGEHVGGDLITNLFHIARHMAQNGEPPVFFPFEDRENHDLDKLAKKFSFEDDLGALALNETLITEYNRKDRYWRAIYYNYGLFKSQYDACVNRLLDLLIHGKSEQDDHRPVIQHPDVIQPREPSEEVKDQVKARDSYRCLCCGENNKRRLQIDHVAPSYYGGINLLDNLQTLCKTCNQTKGINTLNFHVHQTFLTSPLPDFPVFKLPANARSSEEWEKFLRRSINFFYSCSAIEFVRIGRRGQYFYEWYIYLYAGNDPLWLKPHLEDLVKRINYARQEAGLQEIEGIRVGAPDESDVALELGVVETLIEESHNELETGKDTLADSQPEVVAVELPRAQLEAYCVKCKTNRPMLRPQRVRLKNGKLALTDRCPKCGTTVYRFISE